MRFIRNGSLIEGDALEAEKSVTKPKRGVDLSKSEAWHKGWSVEGHPAGYRAACQKAADDAVERWVGMTDEGRRRAIRDGRREPKPWDEAKWLRDTKRKRVRMRPFEIESAAHELKAMAEKAGWEFVEVVALTKGEAPANSFL